MTLLNIKTYLTSNVKQHRLVGLLIASGFAFAFSDNLWEFARLFAGIFISLFTIWYVLTSFLSTLEFEENRTEELEKMLLESDGVIREKEEEIVKHLADFEELNEVIYSYEKQLDSFATELPCPCGGKFHDIFYLPGVENETVCAKCGAKYKVGVSFDSILVSEPLTDNVVETISNI